MRNNNFYPSGIIYYANRVNVEALMAIRNIEFRRQFNDSLRFPQSTLFPRRTDNLNRGGYWQQFKKAY
jgi:hypothetical protein